MSKVLLLFVLATTGAQVFPSCGGESGSVVIGWVEAKRVDRINDAYVVVINNIEYDVPQHFWRDVQVGDLVKWDGRVWTILRRAGS